MMVKCPVCKGEGEYNSIQKWEGKEIIVPVKCDVCGGTGEVEKSATYTGKRRV
jgi:DnaJ-class molecular chaperone